MGCSEGAAPAVLTSSEFANFLPCSLAYVLAYCDTWHTWLPGIPGILGLPWWVSVPLVQALRLSGINASDLTKRFPAPNKWNMKIDPATGWPASSACRSLHSPSTRLAISGHPPDGCVGDTV